MRSALARVAIAVIRGYQRWISPLHPPTCRFRPTCSEYAVVALERFGPWRGGLMAIGRLLRCHPLHPGGYDPVPQAVGSLARGEGG